MHVGKADGVCARQTATTDMEGWRMQRLERHASNGSHPRTTHTISAILVTLPSGDIKLSAVARIEVNTLSADMTIPEASIPQREGGEGGREGGRGGVQQV